MDRAETAGVMTRVVADPIATPAPEDAMPAAAHRAVATGPTVGEMIAVMVPLQLDAMSADRAARAVMTAATVGVPPEVVRSATESSVADPVSRPRPRVVRNPVSRTA